MPVEGDWTVDDRPFLMPRREIFATVDEARTRAHEVLHDFGHVDGLDVTTRLENLTIGMDRSAARAVGVASIGHELIAVVLGDHDARLRVVDMGDPDRYLHRWIQSHERRHVDTRPSSNGDLTTRSSSSCST